MTSPYQDRGIFAIQRMKECDSVQLVFDDFIFSAGGGFLFGAVAGYAIKKVIKIAAVVIGLFVAALAYLSYKGFVDVKWIATENATRSALTNASGQVVTHLTTQRHSL